MLIKLPKLWQQEGTGEDSYIHLVDRTLSVAAIEKKKNCCFTSTETLTLRTIKNREPKMATSTFTQLLSYVWMPVQCCFTSTETTGTVRDREPRTATLSFTQLLSSVRMRVQSCFTSVETVGTIRDTSPGQPPRLSHSFPVLN